jgi:hypothetical protein
MIKLGLSYMTLMDIDPDVVRIIRENFNEVYFEQIDLFSCW